MAELGQAIKVKDKSLGNPTARPSRKAYPEAAREEEATEGPVLGSFLCSCLYPVQGGTWRREAPPKLHRGWQPPDTNYSDLHFWSDKIWQIYT